MKHTKTTSIMTWHKRANLLLTTLLLTQLATLRVVSALTCYSCQTDTGNSDDPCNPPMDEGVETCTIPSGSCKTVIAGSVNGEPLDAEVSRNCYPDESVAKGCRVETNSDEATLVTICTCYEDYCNTDILSTTPTTTTVSTTTITTTSPTVKCYSCQADTFLSTETCNPPIDEEVVGKCQAQSGSCRTVITVGLNQESAVQRYCHPEENEPAGCKTESSGESSVTICTCYEEFCNIDMPTSTTTVASITSTKETPCVCN